MDFQGKTVWITGASSGIGAALAEAFCERGARLILSARRTEKLRAVREACQNGQRHRVLPLDLSDTASLEAAAEEALSAGPVDLLVHNGGVSQRARAQDTPLSVDRRIMEVNYFGAVTLTKAVLPSMLERGQGRFVVVSSLVGKFGTPKRSAYAASKHALHGFFDALRAEVYDAGVRVTMACPGFVRTRISEKALSQDGLPHGEVDRAQAGGISSAYCARQILEAAAHGKDEVYIGGRETWGVYIKRFSPRLFNYVIRRSQVT